MLDYNPLFHPFELPVQKLIVSCVTEQHLFLEPHEGSTPGTTLSGVFGTALWLSVCHNRSNGACHTQNPQCQEPSKCILPWLYKPYSKVQHRNFARPVLLRSTELEGIEPVNVFSLEVTLWGRHAIAFQDAVIETLKKMGELGLTSKGTSIPFTITDIQTMPCLTLAERIESLPQTPSVLLEFQTPFLHVETKSQNRHQFHTAEQLPIVNILGNVAYNLAAWDMEDRDLGEKLESKVRHNLARDTRDMAWEIAERLFIRRTHLSPVKIGKRYSRGNRQTMLLQGFVGLVELSGDLENALPWLLVLALGGGGQKRSMGFGSVKMWLDSTVT